MAGTEPGYDKMGESRPIAGGAELSDHRAGFLSLVG